MLEKTGSPGEIRNLIVVAGNAEYAHATDIPEVPVEIQAVLDVFGRLGHVQGCDPLLGHDAAGLRHALSSWARDEDRADDCVALYYSGHGDFDHDDRHYLLCRDGEEEHLAATALAVEDMVRIVTESGVNRLLLIIDACYAGKAVVDSMRTIATKLTADLTITRGVNQRRIKAFSVIAAARSPELARPGAFADALLKAVDDRQLGGRRQRHLYVEQLVDRVNRALETAARQAAAAPGSGQDVVHQHAAWGALSTGEGFAFLPNPRYVPGAGKGRDCAEEDAGQAGSGSVPVLAGRSAVVEYAAGLLEDVGTGQGGPVVVTGSPGMGKSALLARLVSYAGERQDASSYVAVDARRMFLPDVVVAMAEQAGLPPTRSANELLDGLRMRRTPLVVVLDSLDEAGLATDTKGDESYLIVRELLKELAQVPCVRLLVATQERLVAALGPDFHRVDLDDERWTDLTKLTEYTQRLLHAPDGAGGTSAAHPSVGQLDDPTAPLARAIVERSQGSPLICRVVARALARDPALVDTASSPEWTARLPAVVEGRRQAVTGALRWALWEQFGPASIKIQALLVPLAFAEGPGLPWPALWPRTASAIFEQPLEDSDIDWLLSEAGAYIVEDADSEGRSVYRPAHEALAEQIRADAPKDAQRSMTRALLDLARERTRDGMPDWTAVDPYIRDHLAAHAAAADLLDELLADPLFLISANGDVLSRVLPDPLMSAEHAAYLIYREILDGPVSTTPEMERAVILAKVARYVGAHKLAARTEIRFPDPSRQFTLPPLDSAWSHLIVKCPVDIKYSVIRNLNEWKLTATSDSPAGFKIRYIPVGDGSPE